MSEPTAAYLLAAAEEAALAAKRAEDLRAELRWETDRDEPDRIARIEAALVELSDVMVPLRSAIGRFAGGWATAPAGVEDTLRTTSAYVQYQRKQLKKMRP